MAERKKERKKEKEEKQIKGKIDSLFEAKQIGVPYAHEIIMAGMMSWNLHT
jgi:hypothetical protein